MIDFSYYDCMTFSFLPFRPRFEIILRLAVGIATVVATCDATPRAVERVFFLAARCESPGFIYLCDILKDESRKVTLKRKREKMGGNVKDRDCVLMVRARFRERS